MTTANPLANDSGCLQLKACYLPLNFKGGLKGALPHFSVFCLIAADQIPPSNSYGGHDYTRGGRFKCAPRRTFMLRTLVCLAALKFKCISFLSSFFFGPVFLFSPPDFLCPPFYFPLVSLLPCSLWYILLPFPFVVPTNIDPFPSLPLFCRSPSSPPHQPSLEPSSPTFLSSFPHPG